MPQLIYLFDPLCGWCYGASPAIAKLSQTHHITPLPTGLFADSGKVMNKEFARYAWQNDKRIAQLTGVVFSDAYRQKILAQATAFDSREMINALSWVKARLPEKELAVLTALQQARYMEGEDTGDWAVVQRIVNAQGLDYHLEDRDTAQHLANQNIAQGQTLAQQFDLRGVPQLLLQTALGYQVLESAVLFEQEK